MDANSLSMLLLATLSPNQQELKRAQEQLKLAAKSQGFGLVLLELCKMSSNLDVAKASAICFKNHVKLNWDVTVSQEAGQTPDMQIHESEKARVKEAMIDLMCTVHPSVQKQLSEAVRLIAEQDWPAKWESLLPSLVARLEAPNQPLPVLVGVLSTMNELFKRFRDAPHEDSVLIPLKIALDGCQEPLLRFFKASLCPATFACADPATAEHLYSAVRLTCRIFFSLNWQTIPEFFEDNAKEWMEEFLRFITLEKNPFPAYNDDENPSPLERVQTAVLENISLYAEKYGKEFEPFLEQFALASFSLLIRCSATPLVRFDDLVNSGVRFLSSAAASRDNARIFGDPNTIQAMLERIVVPNMAIRDYDMEAFEDNPLEYLRRDIESSDAETRRRMACDMIEKLCRNFDDLVTGMCSRYIQHLLQSSSSGAKDAWKAKDAAITLVLAVSVRASTQRDGATQVKDVAPVLAFLRSSVVPELQNPASHPILKADAIKYIAVFRQFIPKEEVLGSLLPLLVTALDSKNVVVHTYAAAAIDGILGIREGVAASNPGSREARFKRQDVSAFAQPVLVKLFNLIDVGGVNYNEYLMKCVVRLINVSREDVGPAVPSILQKLGETLWRVAQNPSNPVFNHFLFESIAALLKYGFESRQCTVAQLEAAVLPSFGFILEKNISEFVPYVLQIMAQTLSMRAPGAELSGHHQILFPIVMNQETWELRGNVPALVMLLEAYLNKAPQLFPDDTRFTQLFDIFNRLIMFKSTEDLSFELMRCVVVFVPFERISQRITTVLQLSFAKYMQTKSVALAKSLVSFLGVILGKRGPAACAQCCESLQAGLFRTVLMQIIIPTLPKVTDPIAKKAISVGLTRTLCEYQALDEATWAALCVAQVKFLGGKSVDQGTSGFEQRLQVNDTLEQMAEGGSSASFARLAFARDESLDDFFPEAKDAQAFFMNQILNAPGMGNKAMMAMSEPALATMFKMWANGRV